MDESVRQAAEAAVTILTQGPDAAMNSYNQKKNQAAPEAGSGEQSPA